MSRACPGRDGRWACGPPQLRGGAQWRFTGCETLGIASSYGSVRVPRITGTTFPATRTVSGRLPFISTETSMRLG